MTGTYCIEVKDPSREEKLSKKGGKRRIMVRFYYPGVEDPNKKPIAFMTKNKLKDYGVNPEMTAAYDQRVKLYEGLEMREGKFPLVLFSHGFSSCAEANSDLCSAIAESGYIVASVSHPYEASETVFEDGTSVRFVKSLYTKMTTPFISGTIDQFKLLKKKLTAEEALKEFDEFQKKYGGYMVSRLPEWAEDHRLAVRRIRELAEDAGSILYRKIDFSNGIGATGHSFGGATAYLQCLLDDEISCGVNIDGGLFGDFGEQVNHKPFMQIINPRNYNAVTRSMFYHDKPVHFMTFRDMAHIGFCDEKFLSKKYKLVGTSDPVRTMNTLNAAHIAFFDRYLKQGDTDNAQPLDLDTSMLEKYEVC